MYANKIIGSKLKYLNLKNKLTKIICVSEKMYYEENIIMLMVILEEPAHLLIIFCIRTQVSPNNFQ